MQTRYMYMQIIVRLPYKFRFFNFLDESGPKMLFRTFVVETLTFHRIVILTVQR